VPVLAEVSSRLGAEHVIVAHGHPGIDEVSASGPTLIGEALGGQVRNYELVPESVGIARGSIDALRGGDATVNAAIVRSILAGETGARRDIVLMNAAAGLLAADAVADLAEGVAKARESIDSGQALARLEALITLTQRLAKTKAAS
jgi:anthranilate phosphoribosyltransferase